MRTLIILFVFLSTASKSFCQIEVSSGYAYNRRSADGPPIHIGYDFKLANRFYTKSQIGYKDLYHFDDFVEVNIRTVTFEFHQTLSYEVVKRRKYIFKPNIGVHYKKYDWVLVMVPPLNALPGRAWVMDIDTKKTMVLTSTPEGYYDSYKVSIPGYSIQLQNQFLLKDRLWMHITPFLEPDYRRGQNMGGCYVGLIYK